MSADPAPKRLKQTLLCFSLPEKTCSKTYDNEDAVSVRDSDSTAKEFSKCTGTNSRQQPESTAPSVTSTRAYNDIGLYAKQAAPISVQLRYELLTSPWSPNDSYNFPVCQERGKRRKFQLQWLTRFPWLAYSQEKERAFCRYCCLFATDSVRNQELKKLVKEPLCLYKDAIETFFRHENAKYHQDTMVRAEAFKANAQNKDEDIAHSVDSCQQKQALENRKRITPIIMTIIFCGRQELPLRGHRDHGSLNVTDNKENDGVYRAALRFRVDAGDVDLKNHLDLAGDNATYISWEIQNDIIDACGSIITKIIAEDVKNAKYFSIIVDETTDSATREQCSLSVRFVHNCSIIERFLSFCDLKGNQTGGGIAETICSKLSEIGLDVSLIRGQGYDGASAMSGIHSGVQAEVKKLVPSATYVHCASHVLNLATLKACTVTSIRNAHGQIAEAVNFFHISAKRTTILQKNVQEQDLACDSGTKLKRVNPTRWVEGHSSVIKFVALFPAVVSALEEISSAGDESGAKADCLLKTICTGEFIVALVIMEEMSALLLPLSKSLQSPSADLLLCMSMVDETCAILKDRRQNVESRFQKLFCKASKIAEDLGVEINVPRRASRQIHQENYPASSAEEYYRRSVYIPYLDSMTSQLEFRFDQHHKQCLQLQCLIPSRVVKASFSDLAQALQLYSADLSSRVVIEAEFDRWQMKWKAASDDKRPAIAAEAFSVCDKQCFPNIHALLQIFLTLPVTSATAERSFSSLRRLTTYLRSTMGQDRLNGLAHLTINRDLDVPIDRVFEELTRKKRRLNFVI